MPSAIVSSGQERLARRCCGFAQTIADSTLTAARTMARLSNPFEQAQLFKYDSLTEKELSQITPVGPTSGNYASPPARGGRLGADARIAGGRGDTLPSCSNTGPGQAFSGGGSRYQSAIINA